MAKSAEASALREFQVGTEENKDFQTDLRDIEVVD